MSGRRVEPFQLALAQLRKRLREGDLAPGARVTAKEVADDLRLSATPVREALSRLAGEGLLDERRGDGFFVRGLDAADIAVLYRLSAATLDLALRDSCRARADLAQATAVGALEDPIGAVERLFTAWVADSNSPVLMAMHHRLVLQLGAVRRLEPQFIGDLGPEAEALANLARRRVRRERRHAILTFHERRLPLAQQLSDALAR